VWQRCWRKRAGGSIPGGSYCFVAVPEGCCEVAVDDEGQGSLFGLQQVGTVVVFLAEVDLFLDAS